MSQEKDITGNSNTENLIQSSQLGADFLNQEISEKIPDAAELQYDIAKEENLQKKAEIFSVQNTFMIREKRDMQNYVNAVADEMGVENSQKEKVLLSYSKMMQLNAKIQQQKQSNYGDPYGLGEMKRKVIEDFVREKTEANVTFEDKNEKQNKRSSKSRKNDKISRRRKKNKKNKNSKSKGVSLGKVSGGIFAALGSLYWVTA